jgi:Flp pilus assembly protein TadB
MAFPAVLLGLVPDLVNKAISLFDKKFQSEAEKQQAIQQFKLEAETKLQQAWNEEQEQLTKRHQNDMTSDSWLSKNIRPTVLIYLMVLFTLAFWYAVPAEVLAMLKDLMMTVFIFYFGARGLEKVVSIVKK